MNVSGNIWMTIITQRLERVVDAKTVIIVLTTHSIWEKDGRYNTTLVKLDP